MKKKYIFISIFIVVVVGLYGLNLYLDNRNNNNYVFNKEDVIKEIKSDDEKNTAIAYIDSGGATTSWIPGVAIKSKESLFTYKTEVVFTGYRSKELDIKWQDNNTLIIYHNTKDEDIKRKIEEIKGIKIIYKKIDKETSSD